MFQILEMNAKTLVSNYVVVESRKFKIVVPQHMFNVILIILSSNVVSLRSV